MNKLLPTYRLDRKWVSDLNTAYDGTTYLRSGTKFWELPAFDPFSWKSIRSWIVFWMAKRKGLIEVINK